MSVVWADGGGMEKEEEEVLYADAAPCDTNTKLHFYEHESTKELSPKKGAAKTMKP